MKKLFPVLLSAVLLITCAFAVNVNFTKPADDIISKIENAVSRDGYEIFCKDAENYFKSDFMAVPEKTGDTKITVEASANINGNYLITYLCDGVGAWDGFFKQKLGNYAVRLYMNGNAVYLTDEDKIISYKEAYNTGVITDKDLDYLYSQAKKNKADNLPFFIEKHKSGDVDLSGEVDYTDFYYLMQTILNKCDTFPSVSEFSDIDSNGTIDIFDLMKLKELMK